MRFNFCACHKPRCLGLIRYQTSSWPFGAQLEVKCPEFAKSVCVCGGGGGVGGWRYLYFDLTCTCNDLDFKLKLDLDTQFKIAECILTSSFSKDQLLSLC